MQSANSLSLKAHHLMLLNHCLAMVTPFSTIGTCSLYLMVSLSITDHA